MTAGGGWRPRVVVCGTGFGRTYLAGLTAAGMPFDLVGILARGSARSRAAAGHHGVPLCTDPDQLPAGVDLACVVVDAGINGGRGAELSQRLMARGIHVLQEHPLHEAELAQCLRAARRHRVVYHVNSNYRHVAGIAAFVGAARRLLDRQDAVLVDAVTGFPVLYPALDVLGQALGGLRPWSLRVVPPEPGVPAVLRSVTGVLAGVPLTLRVQNQLHAGGRDNGPHVFMGITLATEGGTLMLADAHGPVLWSPRLHMPPEYRDAATVDGLPAGPLDLPGCRVLGPPVPSHAGTIRVEWPAATARALLDLRRAVLAGEDPLPRGQYHLALSRLTAELTGALGRPELLTGGAAPRVAEADEAVGRPGQDAGSSQPSPVAR